MTTTLPIKRARAAFNTYAAMDAPKLPPDSQSSLQVQLVRWQQENFGGASLFQMLAGVSEEVGELAHAILKHDQKIRGFDNEEKFREAAGDAVADTVVYLTQLCTLLRLDFGTLVTETAHEVMQRDWKAKPETAHEWKSPQLELPLACPKFEPPDRGAGLGCRECKKPMSAHPGFELVNTAS